MKPYRRKICWDTTCWLAWLNDERFWPTGVITGIQDVVAAVEENEIALFASVMVRGEIFRGRYTAGQQKMLDGLLRRPNVVEINADPRIMTRAAEIREYHKKKSGLYIHGEDATHLATAVLYQADEFQTMDGLQKNGSKRKLLALNGDVAGYKLSVVNPYPWNAVPAELVSIEGPLFKKPEKEQHEKQKRKTVGKSL